ncbi:MAG TPA: EVE domain-containing protein [Microthrixaceae bacterium]|nr:EVE domain-containing protein [Microthrixaceae bacterium]
MTTGEHPLRPTTIARLRNGEPVAAWVLKARPSLWDIGAALRAGVELDWWRLAHSYRAELVGPGHPCVMWVTRGDPDTPAGVWAVGTVTGLPVDDSGDPDDPLWLDEAARRQVRPRIPVELEVLERPVLLEEVRDHPVLSGTEVLRVPRIGNPAALTPDEWAALEELLAG